MTVLAAGLILFLGVHAVSIVNAPWRDVMVANIGKTPWRVAYSAVAAVGLLLIVWGYGLARQAPVPLYAPPLWVRQVALVLMLPVFPLFFAPYFPGRISRAAKHPMLLATKLWATVHLFVNGSLADVILFGSFLAWAAWDRVSLKRREQRPLTGAPPSNWNDVIVLLLGLAVYAAFIAGVHVWLVGVPVGSPWG